MLGAVHRSDLFRSPIYTASKLTTSDAIPKLLLAATARCFAWKLGMQPDRVLLAVMDDRMVAKGLVLHWVTAFFQDYLATETLDDLVALLRKTRLDTRLMDFFPPHKRTLADFDEHFQVISPLCSSFKHMSTAYVFQRE